MKPIMDPIEQREKTFLVVATGQVITLRRHDACAEQYNTSDFRRVTSSEVAQTLSPAATRKRALDRRRASQSKFEAHKRALPPEVFRNLVQK